MRAAGVVAAGRGLGNGGRRRQLHIRARIDPYMRRVTIVRAFMSPSMVTTERSPQKGSAEREFVTALSHATRNVGGWCDDGGASTASPRASSTPAGELIPMRGGDWVGTRPTFASTEADWSGWEAESPDRCSSGNDTAAADLGDCIPAQRSHRALRPARIPGESDR